MDIRAFKGRKEFLSLINQHGTGVSQEQGQGEGLHRHMKLESPAWSKFPWVPLAKKWQGAGRNTSNDLCRITTLAIGLHLMYKEIFTMSAEINKEECRLYNQKDFTATWSYIKLYLPPLNLLYTLPMWIKLLGYRGGTIL